MKRLAAALAGLCLCTCGTGSIAFQDWCTRYSQFACDAADHCGCLDDTTRAFCPTLELQQCQDDVEKSVNAGTKTYDPNLAGQCLHDLGAIVSDCSLQSDSYPDSCDKMLVGALAAGATCASGDECQPGLSCANQVCTAMPAEGQACPSGDCADKLFCGSDKICHTPRAQGGSCAEGSFACADGLFCDPKTTTCQPYYGAGADCSAATYACQDGLYCAGSSTCTPYPGEGGSCLGSNGTCSDGLYCDDSHVCQAEHATGAACAHDEECQSDSCVNDLCAQGCVFL